MQPRQAIVQKLQGGSRCFNLGVQLRIAEQVGTTVQYADGYWKTLQVRDRESVCNNPTPSACSRKPLQLAQKTRPICCPPALPLQHSAMLDPSPLLLLHPPASATTTRHDRTGGPAAHARCNDNDSALQLAVL